MAKQVKHTITGELLDNSKCFKIKVGARNTFYIDEDDYFKHMAEKENKAITVKAFRRLWISMMTDGFKKEDFFAPMTVAFERIYEKYPADFLIPRLRGALDDLDWIRVMKFGHGKAKMVYLLKVLTTGFENDIIDYKRTKTYAKMNVKQVDDNLFDLAQQVVAKKDVNSIDEFI